MEVIKEEKDMSPRKATTKAAAAEVKEAVKATPVTTEDKKTETSAKKAPVKRAAAKKETAAAKKIADIQKWS